MSARLCHVLASCCVVLLWLGQSWAAVRTEVSARKVGVGQPITVNVTYVQQDGEPAASNPQLKVQGAAEVRGPSISSQSRVTMNNFNFTSEKSTVARYQVVPTKEGKLIIGPGSFSVGGRRAAGEVIEVEVVSAAQAPNPRRRDPLANSPFANDPFFQDMFGDPDDDPLGDFMRRRRGRMSIPDAPPEYQLKQAADPTAFLHAFVDKKKVVVGEPIRVSIVAYGARGNFAEQSPTEPSLGDFLSYRALDNPQAEPTYSTEIAGVPYIVRKLREYILVPLKSGQLTVGAMTTVLNGPGYPREGSRFGFSVNSLPLAISVSEPPSSGRPAGYLLGDVGRYSLEAQVTPRRITQGEFVEVLIKLSGEGNLPSQLMLPEGNGLLWEQPAIKGAPEVRDDILQGERTFKYALQLQETGHVELGEVSLPYWDHKRGKYAVAQAKLGAVDVEAAAAARGNANGIAADSPSSTLDSHATQSQTQSRPLAARAALASGEKTTAAPRKAIAAWWWLLVALSPVCVVILGGASSALRKWRGSKTAASKSTWKGELKQVDTLLQEGKSSEALRLAERVLFDAIEHAVSVKARGVLRQELAATLQKAGLDAAFSEQVPELLTEMENSRYGGSGTDVASVVAQSQQISRSLFQRRPVGKGKAA